MKNKTDLEEKKREWIFAREIPKTLIWYSAGAVGLSIAIFFITLTVLAVMYLPGLANELRHSAKASAENTEHISGQFDAGATTLNRILTEAEPQAKEALAHFVSASQHFDSIMETTSKNVPPILAGFGSVTDQGSGLVADIRRDSLPLVNRNLETLNSNQGELGKTIPTLSGRVGDAIGEFQASAKDIRESPGYVATFGADGSLVHFNRMMKGFEPLPGKLGVTFDNTAGITASFNRMGKDAADKWHSILYPDPVHGFWPRVRQGVGYVIRPAAEGIRIYQQFSGLPVSLRQPISIIPK